MTRLLVGSMFAVTLLVARAAGATGPGPDPGDGAAAPPRVRLEFRPVDALAAEAARDYERIWDADGERIVRVMEAVSGLSFTALDRDTMLRLALVGEPDCTGGDGAALHLPAAPTTGARRAMLTHEIGHRLQAPLLGGPGDDHAPLFLWLYDVWVQLYGREFADAQVAADRRRGGVQAAAWDAVAGLTRAQRAARWQALVDERFPTRRSRGRLWLPGDEEQQQGAR